MPVVRPVARRSMHDSAPSAIALAASGPARSSTSTTSAPTLTVSTPTPIASRPIKRPFSRSPGTGLRISARRLAMPIIHSTASGRGRHTCTMARYPRSGICCKARRTGLGSLAGVTMCTTKKKSGSSPIRPKPNALARYTIPPSPAMGTAATSMGRSSPTRRSGRWSST